MSLYEMDSAQLRKLVNGLMLIAFAGFLVSSALVFNEYMRLNQARLEARFWPPTKHWTFREWEQDSMGRWSAEVYYYKDRPECLYVGDQVVTVTYINPDDQLGEAGVTFIGDLTDGNTRPGGWQRLDTRLRIESSNIAPGAVIRGFFLHQCHEGLPTTSGFKNIIVGEQMPWPKGFPTED